MWRFAPATGKTTRHNNTINTRVRLTENTKYRKDLSREQQVLRLDTNPNVDLSRILICEPVRTCPIS
jgi:hypothetical protein